VRAETRHQLKQDRLQKATEETVHWAVEHRSKVITVGTAVVILALVIGGAWFYLSSRDRQASAELAKAIRTYSLPIRPAGVPDIPGSPSFASAGERAKAAHSQFQAIADKYAHTRNGQIAEYFSALTARDMGDMSAAENGLKEIADSRNRDLSSLAKMALASIYRDSKRETQAIELYRQLIDKPSNTVPKAAAQLELADLYESRQQTADARRIYEQIQKDNPTSEAAQKATERIREIVKQNPPPPPARQ
jgi:tetratricopeptide (TPR) repeat protein